VNYRKLWVIFLCLSVLSTLCCSSNTSCRVPATKQKAVGVRMPAEEAMRIIYSNGHTGVRIRNAWIPVGFLVAASLGLLTTARGLYCKDKKRQALLRKSLSAVREAPELLGTDRASRARRKKQRWLMASGLACLSIGMLCGIPAIVICREISEAKRALMYSA